MTTVMVMTMMAMTIVFIDLKSALRQFEAFVKSMDLDSRLMASVEIPRSATYWLCDFRQVT